MNHQDIRVIKTNESIENALFTLLRSKPLSKVTVTELTRIARINKGTFYLHYLDIPDLYSKILRKTISAPIEKATFFPDFFDDPERFMDKLGQVFVETFPRVETLMQGQSERLLLDPLVSTLSGKVYETGRLTRCVENDVRLDAVFGALLSAMPKYYDGHKAEVDAMMVSLIRFFFGGK